MGLMCLTPMVQAESDSKLVEFYEFIPNDLCVIEYDITDVHLIIEDKSKKIVEEHPSSTASNPASDNQMKPSDMIALAAVFLSVLTLWLNYLIASNNHKNSVHDEFWMRQILIPKFMQPFMKFIDESVGKYVENDRDLAQYYVKYARIELNQLQDSILVISAVNPYLGEELTRIIENFHDIAGDGERISNLANFKEELLLDASRKVVLAIKAEQLRKRRSVIAIAKSLFNRVFNQNRGQGNIN